VLQRNWLVPGRVIAFLVVDLLWYLYHRSSHRIRLLWAMHQAHHSSIHFNYTTALRQKWNPGGELLFWVPLPLIGLPPWMTFFVFSVNLVYQFWVHTETIPKLWRPLEVIFNSPSHHRVHHASDRQYLDRNYGGILIVWDRLFGTYAEEVERPTYGLIYPVTTYNPFRLQYGEFGRIARDVRSASVARPVRLTLRPAGLVRRGLNVRRPPPPGLDRDPDDGPGRRLHGIRRVLVPQSPYAVCRNGIGDLQHLGPPVPAYPPQRRPVLGVVVDEDAHPGVRGDVGQSLERRRRLRLAIDHGPDDALDESEGDRHEVRLPVTRHGPEARDPSPGEASASIVQHAAQSSHGALGRN